MLLLFIIVKKEALFVYSTLMKILILVPTSKKHKFEDHAEVSFIILGQITSHATDVSFQSTISYDTSLFFILPGQC